MDFEVRRSITKDGFLDLVSNAIRRLGFGWYILMGKDGIILIDALDDVMELGTTCEELVLT